MSLEIVMMTLSFLLVCSFFYDYLLDKFRIPSVLLLIATGILLKFILGLSGQQISVPQSSLGLFGTLGLITIVLEAVLDLKIAKHNYKSVGVAFLSATFTIILTMVIIALLLHIFYAMSLWTALIYATPLSIVSSAIIIPSVAKILPAIKEFLIFESIFSDIVGVIIFNFLIVVDFNNTHGLWQFIISIFIMFILSGVVSIPLALVMNYSKRNHQHIFILAVLVFMYALAKYFHFSALILILIFGFLLNNISLLFSNTRFKKLFDQQSMVQELKEMQDLTSELAFIIRTFFFILFGYMIDIRLLLNLKVLIIGLIIMAIIYGVRYASFRIFCNRNIVFNSLIAPRGLITVLLFYQVPNSFEFKGFDEGIIFFVVILSSIIMSMQLIKNKGI